LAVFEQYGFDLRNLIKTFLYTTKPEIIILGGTIAKAFPFSKKQCEKGLNHLFTNTV